MRALAPYAAQAVELGATRRDESSTKATHMNESEKEKWAS